MSEPTSFSEAPVSFNVRCTSPAGFDCMLTLRAIDAADLMPRALKALEWLTAQGFTAGPVRTSHTGNGNSNAPTCPTHHTPMKASQHGGWYCPVKVADDDGTGKPVYCKQKSK